MRVPAPGRANSTFRGAMKIGSAVPTLTFAVHAGRNPSFRPLGPARVAFPTLLSHGEVIESVGRCQNPVKTMLQQRQLKITVVQYCTGTGSYVQYCTVVMSNSSVFILVKVLFAGELAGRNARLVPGAAGLSEAQRKHPERGLAGTAAPAKAFHACP